MKSMEVREQAITKKRELQSQEENVSEIANMKI